jgi:hypothetical protein
MIGESGILKRHRKSKLPTQRQKMDKKRCLGVSIESIKGTVTKRGKKKR